MQSYEIGPIRDALHNEYFGYKIVYHPDPEDYVESEKVKTGWFSSKKVETLRIPKESMEWQKVESKMTFTYFGVLSKYIITIHVCVDKEHKIVLFG
jgi:hypothetical protein